MIDCRQVLNKDLDAHRQKLPQSPADQNNVSMINEEKYLGLNINDEK
jgi:hypothetical protein